MNKVFALGLIFAFVAIALMIFGIVPSASANIGGNADFSSIYVGSIYATSVPSKASVYVDGVYKGNTPLQIGKISVGSHVVKFIKTGYQTVSKTIYVYRNRVTYVNANLIPFPSPSPNASASPSPSIIPSPSPNASVSPSPSILPSPSPSIIPSPSPSIIPSPSPSIAPSPSPSPMPANGSFYFWTTPQGANVYLRKAGLGWPYPLYGVTPLSVENLLPGEYEFELSLVGYATIFGTETVYSGQTTYVIRNMTLNATPSPSPIPSPSIIPSPSPIPDSCNDSDGGRNFLVYGVASGYSYGMPYSLEDYCINNMTLNEYACDWANVYAVNQSCNFNSTTVCNLGRCV